MFLNHADDPSMTSATVADGSESSIESQRCLLKKLHHAVYCHHEGYTLSTLCPEDNLCCAAKRLFQHMSCCADGNCGVPCCKTSRRIWRHYRKCRHVKGCPVCSVVDVPYTCEGVAPRFSKLTSTGWSTSPNHGGGLSPTEEASTSSVAASSTAAVAAPRPVQNRKINAPRDGKENTAVSSEATGLPFGFPRNYRQNLSPPTPPTPPSYHHHQQQQPTSYVPKPTTPPAPFPVAPRTKFDPPRVPAVAASKPPLSPRRPQLALY